MKLTEIKAALEAYEAQSAELQARVRRAEDDLTAAKKAAKKFFDDHQQLDYLAGALRFAGVEL